MPLIRSLHFMASPLFNQGKIPRISSTSYAGWSRSLETYQLLFGMGNGDSELIDPDGSFFTPWSLLLECSPKNSRSMNELHNPQCKNKTDGSQYNTSARFGSWLISERVLRDFPSRLQDGRVLKHVRPCRKFQAKPLAPKSSCPARFFEGFDCLTLQPLVL